MIHPLSSRRSLILSFFFTSGIPALVYQLAWQRVLFRLFGVNMESVTIVVTAFMLGLGIGSLIGSWLADRRFSPLLLIAIIEMAVGLFGVLSLQLFAVLEPLVRDLTLPGQVIAALGLLFLPTALMGMTLPLLAGHFIARSANVGLSTGSLYYTNTMGAVVGCIVAALALFPWLGLQHSVWIAAAINIAIGIAALTAFLVMHSRGTVTGVPSLSEEPSAKGSVFWFLPPIL
jgi:predicted membrane-bound spermidine synthase